MKDRLSCNGYLREDWSIICDNMEVGDIVATTYSSKLTKVYTGSYSYLGDRRSYTKIVYKAKIISIMKMSNCSSKTAVIVEYEDKFCSSVICSSHIQGFILPECNPRLRNIFTLMALKK
jgi:hypothetical protein